MVAHNPLHRSGRAGLPHPAPVLGDDATLTYPRECLLHALPALGPAQGALLRVPFGRSPSLHLLRTRRNGLVRGLPRYYGTVRLPLSVHHRRVSLDFPMRPAAPSSAGGQGISRVPYRLRACMRGVSDRAGSRGVLRYRQPGGGLPHLLTASAPRSDLSRLNGRPARSPVNASPPPCGRSRHDSGPLWLAKPSTCETFIHYNLPA